MGGMSTRWMGRAVRAVAAALTAALLAAVPVMASGSVNGTPVEAVRTVVNGPLTDTVCRGWTWTGTRSSDNGNAGCPITPRLRAWLSRHPEGGDLCPPRGCTGTLIYGMNPICRCQGVSGFTFRLLSRSPARATVLWVQRHLVFVVLPSHGGWLVDDTYCKGRPQTTIYRLQTHQTRAFTCGG